MLGTHRVSTILPPLDFLVRIRGGREFVHVFVLRVGVAGVDGTRHRTVVFAHRSTMLLSLNRISHIYFSVLSTSTVAFVGLVHFDFSAEVSCDVICTLPMSTHARKGQDSALSRFTGTRMFCRGPGQDWAPRLGKTFTNETSYAFTCSLTSPSPLSYT